MKKVREKIHSFGDKWKKLSKKRGYTQKSLSAALNVSEDTVKNWYQGYNYPNINTLYDIANLLDCDFDYLLSNQEYPRKEIADAANITGLSYEAIETLKSDNANIVSVLDFLLRRENGKVLLNDLYNYFFRPMMLVSGPNGFNSDVTLFEPSIDNSTMDINSSDIASNFFYNRVTADITRIKENEIISITEFLNNKEILTKEEIIEKLSAIESLITECKKKEISGEDKLLTLYMLKDLERSRDTYNAQLHFFEMREKNFTSNNQ